MSAPDEAPETSRDSLRAFEARLLRVLTHIHDNPAADLGLDALADVACMSRFHWHRVFHAATGETLADAVRRIRLLKAANALIASDAPLDHIAARHGYADAASFSRAFSAFHQLSPGAFRARGQAIAVNLRHSAGATPMFPVTIETLEPARAAGVLHTGPYAGIGAAFQQLGGILAARNLFAQTRALFAIYHDAPDAKPEAELRSHVAVILGDGFPPDLPGLDYFDVAGGKHAVLKHTGPYATLGPAYDWLYGKWLPQSGEEPRDAPPIELYVNDPRSTPPDQLRTDIRLPLV
jgi:AraC family transcriptional regulator